MSKDLMPTVTEMVGVLITILLTVNIFDVANLESANTHKDGGCLITTRELSLFLMLQIPKKLAISRVVHVPHHPDHGGEGKDLNDLAGRVTIIGRQPPRKGWRSECFQLKIMLIVLRESSPTHHRQGQGVKDLNYWTVMEESKPTKTQVEEEDLRDVSNMQVLLLRSDRHVPECWQLWDIIPMPYHWVGGGGVRVGTVQHCTIHRGILEKNMEIIV